MDDSTSPIEPETTGAAVSGETRAGPANSRGSVHGADEPPRAEEVVPDDDLTLPGSLESIEGVSASPDPEDPGDPTPDRTP